MQAQQTLQDNGPVASDSREDIEDTYGSVAGMLLEESDRGCAIFGAQILSDRLQDLLTFVFEASGIGKVGLDRLFSGYGPLSTFSAKIELAYSLGILPKDIYEAINLTRKMRNLFAHESGPATFDSPECRVWFRQLVAEGKSRDPLEGHVTVETSQGPKSYAREHLSNRLAFGLAIQHYAGHIDGRLEVIRKISAGRTVWQMILASHSSEMLNESEIEAPPEKQDGPEPSL